MADFTGRSKIIKDRRICGSISQTYYNVLSGSSEVRRTDYFDDVNMVSFSHKKQRNGQYKDGGPWLLQKTENILSPGAYTKRNGSGKLLSEGEFLPRHLSNAGSIPSVRSDSNLDSDGTKAFNAVVPTIPTFSLATALGELAGDGLPAMIGSSAFKKKVAVARNSGDEYLNVQFGWAPLVSDLRKFAYNVTHAKQIIDAFEKASNKRIKRKFEFDAVSSVKAYGGQDFVSSTDISEKFTGATTIISIERKWFEGAFRYKIPTGDDILSRLKRYEQYSNILLGTRLTPAVVWNLAPWSWALDWFGNIGTIIENHTALQHDGLVLEYGYMMREHVIEQNTAGHFNEHDNVSGGTAGLKTVRTVKQRRPANPYGFGISGLPTSKRQIAIVAALAGSRT